MKLKLLGLTAGALLLASCTSNEVLDDVPVKSEFIGFENLNDRLTKAANDQNAHYGIFAKATTGASDFYKFNNREVTPGADGDTYSPKELWPSFGLDFFAYAPYNATAPVTFANGTFPFAVPADGQTDLTFAKAANQTTGTVQLAFNHMLSKIQLGGVALAQNLIDAGYTLDAPAGNKIKIYVEKNQGKNNLYTQGDWTELTGTGAMYENNKSYYIMPQPVSSDQSVKIQLNGLRILKGGSVYKENISVKFSWVPKSAIKNTKPTAGADGVFLKGRCYTINFTLGSDASEPDPGNPTDPTKPGEPIFDNYIGFTSSVVDWDCESMTIGVGVGAADILYFDGYGVNSSILQVGKWSYEITETRQLAYFKYGSVQGFTNENRGIWNYRYNIYNPAQWGYTEINYALLKHAGQNEITKEFHFENVKNGLGDPCRLAGLTRAQISFGIIDNGKWRLPTHSENCCFVSGTNSGNSISTSGYKELIGLNGYYFPNPNETSGAFLPAAGYRDEIGTVSGFNTVGRYWPNQPAMRLSFDNKEAKPQSQDVLSVHVGLPVRCVRQ